MIHKLLASLLCFVILWPSLIWADAAHRSDSSTTYATRTNTTCTAPAGIQNGDVLLLVFAIGAASSAPTPTAPSGFAAVTGTWPIDNSASGFNVDLRIWYKIASGESGDYTVTHTNAASQCYIKAVSGGTSGQPAATTNSGLGTTTTASTITPSANNSLVLFVSQDWGDTANALSPPTGTTPTFTERLDPGTVSGILYVADGVLATAGATGNKTITNNSANDGNARWAGSLVVVEAAAGAASETFGFRKRLPQ